MLITLSGYVWNTWVCRSWSDQLRNNRISNGYVERWCHLLHSVSFLCLPCCIWKFLFVSCLQLSVCLLQFVWIVSFFWRCRLGDFVQHHCCSVGLWGWGFWSDLGWCKGFYLSSSCPFAQVRVCFVKFFLGVPSAVNSSRTFTRHNDMVGSRNSPFQN